MSATFESEKNRKAFIYTTIICGAILLIALLVSWKLPQHPPQILQDLIEINLGNDDEGMGEVQPLIKGEKSPSTENAEQQQTAAAKNETAEEIKTDENTDNESAPVNKPVKTTTKVNTPAVVVAPAPKPQKPKIAGYNGPKGGPVTGQQKIMVINTRAINPAAKAMPEAPVASQIVMATLPVAKPVEAACVFPKATAPL